MIEGLNEETLRRLYVEEGKSTRTIAKMFCCSQFGVNYRCRKYGISLRPAQHGKLKGLINREILNRLYVTEQRSTTEIAEMFGCSYTSIRHRCKKYKIKLRPKVKRAINLKKSVLKRLYVKEGKSLSKIAEMFSCSANTVKNRCREYDIQLRGHKRIKGLNKELLQKLYLKEDKTIREIGKIVGCSRDVVRKRCKQFGIKLRPPGVKRKHD